MNRKIIILIISLLLVCGCSNKKREIIEYYVTVDNVDIKVNRLFSYLNSTLGSYNEIKENDSNIVYSYNDIEIETYMEGEEEKVRSFWFTTNKYYTNEGIRIGDNVDKMLYVYGDNYIYINDIYMYELNGSSISFIVDRDVITGIEYSLI